jgi:hypothetical protein
MRPRTSTGPPGVNGRIKVIGRFGKSAAPPYAYDTQANPNYGFGPLVPVDPNDVISGDRIIGRDPDPFIRGEILRHYDSGWPD